MITQEIEEDSHNVPECCEGIELSDSQRDNIAYIVANRETNQ
jgi:hypothetical protein